MTTYFVSGAESLLGRNLVTQLLNNPRCTAVHLCCPPDLVNRMEREWTQDSRVHAITWGSGDTAITGEIEHFVNIGSAPTQELLDFAVNHRARSFHQVWVTPSSDSELRLTAPDARTQIDVRQYRTSLILGDAQTGEPDAAREVLAIVARLARMPRLTPVVLPHLGSANIITADFAAAAINVLMHHPNPTARIVSIAAAEPTPIATLVNAFGKVAGAPHITTAPQILGRPATALAQAGLRVTDSSSTVRATRRAVLREIGLTKEVLARWQSPAPPPDERTAAVLNTSHITVPPVSEYANRMYRFWAANIDPDRHARTRRAKKITGRIVVVTGASSGVGRETALRLAREGAIVALVARRADQLHAVNNEIAQQGGTAFAYPCDLSDADAVDSLIKQILADHGAVDVLVNNAGRSIRRGIMDATDRMHDFERTMALNYFAAVRLTLGFLPSMHERHSGHIVNITTQGLQNHTPRFSAYLASKAALEEFGAVAGSELLSHGITFSSVKLPLVRTDMTAPSEKFNAFAGLPMMSVRRAASMVHRAVVDAPAHVTVLMPTGVPAEVGALIAPRITRTLSHLFGYEAMPAAHGTARGLPAIAAATTRLLWRRL
ncbi:SDR family NAD(P)-dependent oxidoreductase [Hoyosella rhizosphaerae]|uniref:Short chain dehydrogenase n=1 Tax=Hoyosella rhizosphaerae TaxID=1755582 RepID=A0A916XA07_9ACTN|nr:SDR family NAD(P)-dependent oxidoreductase [Hoyosella rhizosphaerae]MBN4926824.1 SDR family NAD(P)-dependent oxidoreductase [Hoyosella rhizosphaerae]GGC56205.1 short chain dehydrogenase [Hoyosella rhizosphaerae]